MAVWEDFEGSLGHWSGRKPSMDAQASYLHADGLPACCTQLYGNQSSATDHASGGRDAVFTSRKKDTKGDHSAHASHAECLVVNVSKRGRKRRRVGAAKGKIA